MHPQPNTVIQDTLSELQNEVYYNDLEIQKLLFEGSGEPYRNTVLAISNLLKANVQAIEAAKLLQRYAPVLQPEAPPAPQQ